MWRSDDIIVVGGGPAGAMCALRLAQQGIPCRVLERSDVFSDKVCGEFLSTEAVARLDQLGFPWQQSGAVEARQVRLMHGNKDVCAPLAFSPTARSVARPVLDTWLLSRAQACGAQVQRGITVRDIVADVGPGTSGFTVKTSAGDLRARALVLATGKHALSHFHPRSKAAQHDLVGYKMNFHNPHRALRQELDHTLGLFFFRGGYGGIARIGDRTITVSLLVQAMACGQNLRSLQLLHTLAEKVPLLRRVLEQSTPAWAKPLTISNLPYGHCDDESPRHEGLFAVGDQFAVLPSFTGTGMAFAMASGAMAAQAMGQAPLDAAAALYAGQARTMARSVQRRAMLLHRALQRPALAALAMHALVMAPSLASFVARTTRLPGVANATGGSQTRELHA